MAQIHALTPEGRLPSGAVEHVKEIAGRSTGWRDITTLVPNRTAGRLLIKRTELEMVVVFDELALSGSGSVGFDRLPAGLRPQYRARGGWLPSITADAGGSVNISGGGYFNVYGVVPGLAMTARIVADFLPGSAFPSPLPGDPA